MEFISSTRYGLVPALTGIRDDSLPFENPDIRFSSDESLVARVFLIPINKLPGGHLFNALCGGFETGFTDKTKTIFFIIIV
ncbi:hypothetical protein K6Y76_09665 [Burkholderia cenocepacia]|jgi:hypothetical protein|uniref:hypothetical protein n=1 Tax=Burkholderia cenocepacia TaxID=95486 RepID=UPI001198292F|nr:hypothetical protein [Burkholderia cenocepacia]MCG0581399.1 hypothetical protein [Burkholderia cenocepacia]MCW3522842.1 hypothetical protein [Burkholderia cenocepacia]MCW3613284.1 hypothetical protein [Burkholderia cenocepacia]MCW3651420.1 hypothetical protein [Burkholderia cenocepacia]MCW3666083.1 hypothetical protein [Burkholderia cenocepacia]